MGRNVNFTVNRKSALLRIDVHGTSLKYYLRGRFRVAGITIRVRSQESAEVRESVGQKIGEATILNGELTNQEERTWDLGASNAEYHYLGSGKTFVRFGKALAEAMRELEK